MKPIVGQGSELSVMLLLLLCHHSLTAAASATKLLSFESCRQCPTAAASLLAQRLASKLQCAAVCSRLKTCNAFHFDQRNNKCYLGDACSELAQWTAGDCGSYKYTDVLCGYCDVAKPVFSQLQMKMFYKFSRSGLVNEVNPRLFCLAAHNVTIDGNGAQFKGYVGSYLRTETPGFAKHLAYGSQFSTYVSASHNFGTSRQYYHNFVSCGSGTPGHQFFKFNTMIYNTAVFKQGATAFSLMLSSPSVLPSSGRLTNSLGFSFNGTANQHFFSNGSMVSAGSSQNGATYDTSFFDCLHLGQAFPRIDANCLQGSMFCYSFSTKVLNQTEFEQIQQLCDEI